VNPDDFHLALHIALRYFNMSGIRDTWIVRPLGEHIHRLFLEGETRPLMLANRAIERMERQLAVEADLRAVHLDVSSGRAS
jgi:hypothetical protein